MMSLISQMFILIIYPLDSRSPGESRKRHEEKQQKAQELRERLLQEKAERLRELSKKVKSRLSLCFWHVGCSEQKFGCIP
jgi:hypothetical protein